MGAGRRMGGAEPCERKQRRGCACGSQEERRLLMSQRNQAAAQREDHGQGHRPSEKAERGSGRVGVGKAGLNT